MRSPSPTSRVPIASMNVATPFETPKAESQAEQPVSRLTRRARWALFLALVPLLTIPVAFGIAPLGPPSEVFAALFAGGALAALAGSFLGVASAWKILRLPSALRPRGVWASITAAPLGLVAGVLGAGLSLMSLVSFTRGRQLRQRGRPVFAPIRAGSPWLGAAVKSGPPAPAGVAEAWRKNGLTEHASVAAFARLSMDLVAMGAPPRLIARAHQDALDELRHTELCFALARDLDGKDLGPGDFAPAAALPVRRGPRSLRLAALAVESLIDGALNEGISARVVAELARTDAEPRAREVLEQIARDEARHAAHGFEIVRWCVQEGGAPVKAALAAALATLPVELGAPLTPLAADGRWERYGLPSRAREARCWAALRPRLIARTQRLL